MIKVALLTSGGDAPGMNTVIYYLSKYSLIKNIKLYGVRNGFDGLIKNEIFELDPNSVATIANKGGSILYSSRSQNFRDKKNRIKAAKNLKKFGINYLIILGGNGSFKGAYLLNKEHDVKVICIPATIDNDINHVHYSLGFDTALNNILEAVAKIDDTATSHGNTFIVEVMGKYSGNLAFNAFIAGAGHALVIPEYSHKIDDILEIIDNRKRKNLFHNIILFSEGVGSPKTLAKELSEKLKIIPKIVTLGHIQRGGAPTAFERIMAEKFAFNTLKLIENSKSNLVINLLINKVSFLPLAHVWSKDTKISEKEYENLISLAKI